MGMTKDGNKRTEAGKSGPPRKYLHHISQHSAGAVAEFVAAAEKNLAAGGAEKLGEALIHGDAEVAARVAAVRDFVALEDGSKGHAAFEDELLRLLGQEIKMDADGSELDGLPIAAAMQYGGADEVVPDARTGGHIEVDVTTVEVAQVRGHITIMGQQVALVIGELLRLDKGHTRARAADAIEEDQWREDVFILPGSRLSRRIKCSEHTGDAGAGRRRAAGGPPGADPRG